MRALGLNVEDKSWLIGDNMSVVINTTLPSSNLKKKHMACNYHRVREAIASGFLVFGHVESHRNLADICTKPLETGPFEALTSQYLFRKPACLINAQN